MSNKNENHSNVLKVVKNLARQLKGKKKTINSRLKGTLKHQAHTFAGDHVAKKKAEEEHGVKIFIAGDEITISAAA